MYQDQKTEIEVIYKNFDGLDVAFQGRIPDELANLLDKAKEKAQEDKQAALITYRGHKMQVGEGGSKGGYAYRCDTGPDGATWFFKKPNAKDPWGIRVSVKALSLALYGLGGTRARIYEFLEGIGARLAHKGESIGRIDYAVDLVIPDFVLKPENMVMHSSMNRSDNKESEIMRMKGKSGRYTSTTAGTMPGRQVIIYDKRAEVIQRNKTYWWRIWNDWRKHIRLPELDPYDANGSQIWRVEVRAGKDHLKKKWGITTWEDLDRAIGNAFRRTLEDVRYTQPTRDANRSRWPNHPIWDVVGEVVEGDLFEMICPVDEKIIKQVLREEKQAELRQQFVGLAATVGVVMGIDQARVAELPAMMEEVLRQAIDPNVPEFVKKMKRAQERYTFLE
jgi:hypothetical protein